MTTGDRCDPYIVLGVARHASAEEIARAYRRAARASHPDTGGAGSAERFQAVSDAYDVLRDPRRRALYDRSHAPAPPRAADAPGGSVRYAAPGSPDIVLGPAAPPAGAPARLSVAAGEEGRSARQHAEIEDLVRIALSLLRARP